MESFKYILHNNAYGRLYVTSEILLLKVSKCSWKNVAEAGLEHMAVTSILLLAFLICHLILELMIRFFLCSIISTSKVAAVLVIWKYNDVLRILTVCSLPCGMLLRASNGSSRI